MTIDRKPNANATTESPEAVLALLDEQATLLRRLEVLANRQRELIATDDTRPLISLLGDRRKVMTSLAGVGGRIESARSDWVAYRERFSPHDAERADQLLREIGDRMKKVIESDEEDARLLSLKRKQAVQGIDSAVASQTAVTAYGAAEAQPSRVDEIHGL